MNTTYLSNRLQLCVRVFAVFIQVVHDDKQRSAAVVNVVNQSLLWSRQPIGDLSNASYLRHHHLVVLEPLLLYKITLVRSNDVFSDDP